MNWDAIGAIGEIVGALAVVATLLYLARETKKSAEAIDATSSRDVALNISEWHRDVANSPELKRIMFNSMQAEMKEYSAEEWFEFRMIAVSLFAIYQNHYVNESLSIGTNLENEKYVYYASTLINSFPAWKLFWDEEFKADTFIEGFVNAVNEKASENISSFTAAKAKD